MNFVSFTFADEHELDRVIDQELGYFLPMEQPFRSKVYEHDLLPSLKDKLLSRNFVEDDFGDVMALDVNNAPPHLLEPVAADIRRVTSVEGLKDIIFVLNRVYGNDNTWVNNRLGIDR